MADPNRLLRQALGRVKDTDFSALDELGRLLDSLIRLYGPEKERESFFHRIDAGFIRHRGSLVLEGRGDEAEARLIVRHEASGNPSGFEVGQGGSGNRYAYLDLVGDDTYTDWALRLIRNNTGVNATSQLLHRGTGALELKTNEAALIKFYTANLQRASIGSGGGLNVGTREEAAAGQVRVFATGAKATTATHYPLALQTDDPVASSMQLLFGLEGHVVPAARYVWIQGIEQGAAARDLSLQPLGGLTRVDGAGLGLKSLAGAPSTLGNYSVLWSHLTHDWPFARVDRGYDVPLGVGRLQLPLGGALLSGPTTVFVATFIAALNFADGANPLAVWNVPLPDGWAGRDMRLTLWWAPSTTNTGNLRLATHVYRVQAQLTLSSTSIDGTTGLYAANGTVDEPQLTEVDFDLSGVSGLDVGAGVAIAVRVARTGTHADDTFAGDMRLLAVELSTVG